MIACVQRCSRAEVRVEDRVSGSIGRGLLVLVGVEAGDDGARAAKLAERLLGLRIFEDANGRMNRSVRDVGGEILVVPQFTLAASLDHGRRPSFDRAAPPEVALTLYDEMVDRLRASGLRVATGSFGARMAVELVNDGPVTFLLEERSARGMAGPKMDR
jgi:D-tyrosyl-tRNA(Tyr) deacylase